MMVPCAGELHSTAAANVTISCILVPEYRLRYYGADGGNSLMRMRNDGHLIQSF